MNKKNGGTGVIIVFILLVMFFSCGKDDKKKSDEPINAGYHSSYWYDSKETRKRKADETLKKYYNIDDEGHITGAKESTVRNGKKT